MGQWDSDLNKLAHLINSKRVRWTCLWRRGNADFEDSNDGFSGDNDEKRLPRVIDLQLLRGLEVVLRLVLAPIGGSGHGKLRQHCVSAELYCHFLAKVAG